MRIKPELHTDTAKRPGYARLLIPDFNAEGDGFCIAIQRNKDNLFLGSGKSWQSQETWHTISPVKDNANTVVTIGPDLVDAVASCISSYAFVLNVKSGGVTSTGVIKKSGVSLMPSSARGDALAAGSQTLEATTPPPPPPPPPQISTPAPAPAPVAVEAAAPPPLPAAASTISSGGKTEGASKLPLIIAAAVALLIIIGGAIAYFMGLIPGLGGVDAEVQKPTPAAVTPALPPAAAPAAPNLATRDIVRDFLATNPTPEATLAKAQELAGESRLDGAMLLYRNAAGKGNPDAAMALAQLYDPAYFSKDTSPLPNADPETAAYWYEGPAKDGNAAAQRNLGRVMLEQNPTGFLRDRAIQWLEKAASAGDAEAAELLSKYK